MRLPWKRADKPAYRFCVECDALIGVLDDSKADRHNGLCERCRMKKNGFVGAKDNQELGIY